MTPENLCWLIGSIGVLFLIFVSALFEIEDKKFDRKWEFRRHNSYATLLILGKTLDLREEREFWGKIWMLEYDCYHNLNIPEKRIYGNKLLSFANTLHTMFYSIYPEFFEERN